MTLNKSWKIPLSGRPLIENVAVLTFFMSVLSQLPAIFENPVLKSVGTLMWVALLAVLVIQLPRIIIHPILSVPLLFDLWIMLCEAATGFTMKYVDSALFRGLHLCTFVLEVGFLMSRYYSPKLFEKLSKAYIYAATIVSVSIFFEYFAGKQITGGFLYGAKNSAASMVLSGLILLCAFGKKIVPFKNRLLWIGLVAFYGLVLIYMQSRTVLLCAVCALVWYVFFVEKRFWIKALIIVACAGVVWYVMNDAAVYDLIVEKIILNGKEADDLNAITSNRVDHLERFTELFPQAPWIGRGSTYLESFPLASLATFGVIGSSFLFLFMFYPMMVGIKLIVKKREVLLGIIIVAVSITLLISGLAEEQTPYGPGVKCFLMWFLAGFAMNAGKNQNLTNK